MYEIAGQRTGGGNPVWLSTQPPAERHAAIVQTLFDAGATIADRTVCDEFFFSVLGANAHYGKPNNPKALGRLAGGSSSGSASAVASGACDLALGSDTGGSVRVPASFCGIYGIRRTHGRVDATGMMPMSPSFDTPGWFASSPGAFSNARTLLDRHRVAAAPQRVVIVEDAFAQVDRHNASFLLSALRAMGPDLPPMETARLFAAGFNDWPDIFRPIQGYEIWQNCGHFVRDHAATLGADVRQRMEYAGTITAPTYASALRQRLRIQADLNAVVAGGTLLALPTTSCVAPPRDIADDDADIVRGRIMGLTCIAGLGGLPQVSLPVGTIDGLPVGLSFIGWKGADEVLLDRVRTLSRHFGMTG